MHISEEIISDLVSLKDRLFTLKMFAVPWFILALSLSMGTVSVTGSLVLIRYVARKSPDRKTVIDLMITDNCRQVLVFTALSTLMVAYPKLCGQEGAVHSAVSDKY